MTCIKKLTALLVSAALALSLLAGCGGSKALSQVIADLLSGQYNNVTVEVDPDLTAALKKAAAAGSTREEVLAALVEELNLSGGSITFNNLGDGQQGQHGVTLTFQAGSDPDAAARSAFTEWNRVFSSLPDDGSYTARVAMIEAEGGYYIAVDVEVLKAGTPDKDDDDGFIGVSVSTPEQLQAVAERINNGETSLNIRLTANIDLENQSWTPIGTRQTPYTGTFDGGDCTISGLSVSSSDFYAGLFGYIKGGTVKNLTLDSPTVNSSSATDAGAVAGHNDGGAIADCHVTGSGNISSSYIAGGVVGYNDGTVTGCYSTGSVTATGNIVYSGGVVGTNSGGGTVTACYATGNVTANGSSSGRAGGVVGWNPGGTVTACYATGDVTATGFYSYAGGVVGTNRGGTVTACYATGTVSGSTAGGVVGINANANTVTACYWSGSVDGNKGIGSGSQADSGEYKENGSNKVSDDTTWEAAVDSMNQHITGYTFDGSMTSPTLKKN